VEHQFCICAIDPGKSGAISFYFPSSPGMIAAEDMPVVDGNVDAATLASRVRQLKPDIVIIEMVGARPGQGVTSMFSFGRSYGTAIGVVAALGVPSHFVTPSRWKKHFNLGPDKEEARGRALQFWPARAELFSRKRDHGRAEAALLARFYAETMAGARE
jgi:hypothetical protein